MTSDTRRELLAALDELSSRFPEWRLGQMITNLATFVRGPDVSAIWDAEDEEFIDAARQLLESSQAAAGQTVKQA